MQEADQLMHLNYNAKPEPARHIFLVFTPLAA